MQGAGIAQPSPRPHALPSLHPFPDANSPTQSLPQSLPIMTHPPGDNALPTMRPGWRWVGESFGWRFANGREWATAMRYGIGFEEDDDFNQWPPSSLVKISLGVGWRY